MIIRYLLMLVSFLCCTATESSYKAPPSQDLVNKLMTKLQSLQTLSATFFESSNEAVEEKSGLLYFKKPHKVCAKYYTNGISLITTDIGKIMHVNDDLGTITYYPIKDNPLMILFSQGQKQKIQFLEKKNNFLIFSVCNSEGELTLVVDDRMQIRQWSFTDSRGMLITVTLKNIVEDKQVDDSVFTVDSAKYQINK